MFWNICKSFAFALALGMGSLAMGQGLGISAGALVMPSGEGMAFSVNAHHEFKTGRYRLGVRVFLTVQNLRETFLESYWLYMGTPGKSLSFGFGPSLTLIQMPWSPRHYAPDAQYMPILPSVRVQVGRFFAERFFVEAGILAPWPIVDVAVGMRL